MFLLQRIINERTINFRWLFWLLTFYEFFQFLQATIVIKLLKNKQHTNIQSCIQNLRSFEIWTYIASTNIQLFYSLSSYDHPYNGPLSYRGSYKITDICVSLCLSICSEFSQEWVISFFYFFTQWYIIGIFKKLEPFFQ